MSGMPRVASAAVLVAVLLALAACAEPGGAPPSPSAGPIASPSATPSPSASASPNPASSASPNPASGPVPTASPSTTVSPSAPTRSTQPDASAAPTPAAATAARYCGDAFVLDRPHLVWWEGDEAAQLVAAAVRPAFEPADAIAGLEVQCVATFSSPVDGDPGGVVRISEAFVERDDAAFATLEAWAAANGYQRASDDRFTQWERPETGDGTSVSIFWAPLDGTEPMMGNAAEIVRQTGVDPDAISVWHGVYTAP